MSPGHVSLLVLGPGHVSLLVLGPGHVLALRVEAGVRVRRVAHHLQLARLVVVAVPSQSQI